MKVLALICQKGGTAKTTTAINLAVEAMAYGLEVAVIDLDPQVSACDWKDIRGDNDAAIAAARVADLVLIPLQPSLITRSTDARKRQ